VNKEEEKPPHISDEEKETKSTSKAKRKRDGSQLRKAPQAPKRFKSSYICFFMAKQQEIKDSLGSGATVTDVSKRSAEMWRTLPASERAYWDDVATKDKHRYMQEKASYTGPWQVPWKRAKKDPSAPKRPMSAFLYFSQERRRIIKQKNPKMRNTDISRVLGEMWRNATEEERGPHIAHEAKEREKYKVAIAKWREEHEAKMEAQRKAQEEQAANAAAYMNMNQQLYNEDFGYLQPQAVPHPQQQMPMPYYDPNMGYPGMSPAQGAGGYVNQTGMGYNPYMSPMNMATNQSNPGVASANPSTYSPQMMYPAAGAYTHNSMPQQPLPTQHKQSSSLTNSHHSMLPPTQQQQLSPANTLQYPNDFDVSQGSSSRASTTQHLNYQSSNAFDPNPLGYSQGFYSPDGL